jgi:RNA polymerase sigma-70 factor (ECF subfamily)
MNADFDVRTSKSLLEKLRVFEDRQAWSRFMSLYLPMIQTWGKRFGLAQDDVEELTSRLLTKLVEVMPRFDYDPAKGNFRSWLKTVTQRELITFARERQRRMPGAGLMLDQADDIDDLVTSLQERSEGMLHCLQDALKEIESEYQGAEQKSWEMFQRIFLAGQAIEPVAAEFGLSYHAAAMRVQRIKKKIRSRALQLALQRGQSP